ncbi:related to REX2 - Oligoribonuclease, mitochondrial precursor [Ustilago trichophora]|uniref:Related to REX2 - Oligoribonuclease, mitochondrial n=1 Tax=Ustilago trichophora TaxID=86804 RepID=A0A5C3EK54_9BASI|nr:related to REX2 - Oligoribonuclease, mitochondrial precursor [Ustilago trichophora]
MQPNHNNGEAEGEEAISPIPPPPATKKLSASDGPLVWIDCEMTGLNIEKGDRLLEVACIITDGDLNPVDEGVSYVISTPKEVLDASLLAYIRDRIPTPSTACLAGNTVHADKAFLQKEMPELINHLHYRIVDVSSLKELVRRWYGAESIMVWKRNGQPTNGNDHRALNDIKGSIDELRWYRQRVFLPNQK